MEAKEMRKALKEAGITCPVSNKDVEIAYSKNFKPKEAVTDAVLNESYAAETGTTSPAKLVPRETYTYIGTGANPPHLVNFMGMQNFVRGQETEVTNEKVLAKIKNSPCFVKGACDQDQMFIDDAIAKKLAEAQFNKDRVINDIVNRRNVG